MNATINGVDVILARAGRSKMPPKIEPWIEPKIFKTYSHGVRRLWAGVLFNARGKNVPRAKHGTKMTRAPIRSLPPKKVKPGDEL